MVASRVAQPRREDAEAAPLGKVDMAQFVGQAFAPSKDGAELQMKGWWLLGLANRSLYLIDAWERYS